MSKNKNNINPNHHWCPWCHKEKLPGENIYKEGPALIPDTAADIICQECFTKMLEQNGVREDYKGNLVEIGR